MGDAPEGSITVILFSSFYIILLGILYSTVFPSVLGIDNGSYTADTSNLEYVMNLFNKLYITFMELGAWNLLLFAPIGISVGFILTALALPNWL